MIFKNLQFQKQGPDRKNILLGQYFVKQYRTNFQQCWPIFKILLPVLWLHLTRSMILCWKHVSYILKENMLPPDKNKFNLSFLENV